MYRDRFKLSSKEFHDEPLDEYMINIAIMRKLSDISNREMKRAERRSKG